MKLKASGTADAVGTALEYTEGRLYEQKCYGTFAEDMPESDFRFRIAFVQHEGDFKLHAHEYSELVFVMRSEKVPRPIGPEYRIKGM